MNDITQSSPIPSVPRLVLVVPASSLPWNLSGDADNHDRMQTPRSDDPDGDLVRRAAAGERDAFAAIYERHRSVVYRFARLMSGSDATAEDVTQEVFVTLMRTLPRYESDRAELLTYLYGVARNVTRNRLRRDRRFVALDAAVEDTDASPYAAKRVLTARRPDLESRRRWHGRC